MAQQHDRGGTQKSIFKAVKYVRMPTEHLQYSTENQADKITKYAERRGIEIVRTYADEGKIGLRSEGRIGLQELIRVVESGQADFQIILVYDISRWGRFVAASPMVSFRSAATVLSKNSEKSEFLALKRVIWRESG